MSPITIELFSFSFKNNDKANIPTMILIVNYHVIKEHIFCGQSIAQNSFHCMPFIFKINFITMPSFTKTDKEKCIHPFSGKSDEVMMIIQNLGRITINHHHHHTFDRK